MDDGFEQLLFLLQNMLEVVMLRPGNFPEQFAVVLLEDFQQQFSFGRAECRLHKYPQSGQREAAQKGANEPESALKQLRLRDSRPPLG